MSCVYVCVCNCVNICQRPVFGQGISRIPSLILFFFCFSSISQLRSRSSDIMPFSPPPPSPCLFAIFSPFSCVFHWNRVLFMLLHSFYSALISDTPAVSVFPLAFRFSCPKYLAFYPCSAWCDIGVGVCFCMLRVVYAVLLYACSFYVDYYYVHGFGISFHWTQKKNNNNIEGKREKENKNTTQLDETGY